MLGLLSKEDIARTIESLQLTAQGAPLEVLTKEDYAGYDLLIGMDNENMRDMLRLFNGDPDKKLHLLPEFAGERGEVADPWYTGNFDETYDDVRKGCKGLLQLLIKNETPIL